jgi:hypothetical protein
MQERGRDDLIDDVQNGRITPEAAEQEATRLGLPPIAPAPDPDSFNPMGEVWWTLVMTLAWVSWRTPRKVCESWDEYRRQCWDWTYLDPPQGRGKGRWYLNQRKPATLSRLTLEATYDKAHGRLRDGWISIEDAKAKLWAALSDDALQATGIKRPSGGERVAIPAHEWRDLAPSEDDDRTVLFARRGELLSRGGGYNDVTLRRQNVMALWPPHGREEWDRLLPATVAPAGPGYMPLYCAVQWIATKGGSITFDPRDTSNWHAPYAELLAHMASDEVAVTGVRDGIGQKVDPHLFASLAIDYPFTDADFDLILSNELYLSSCQFINDEHWRKGFNDNLRSRRGVQWSRLQVLKADVARWWPFGLGEKESAENEPIYKTGAPGRPTSMQLVEAEHAARWERDEALESMVAESEALAAWLNEKHPKAPRLKPKTIRNNLAAAHRGRIAARPKKRE